MYCWSQMKQQRSPHLVLFAFKKKKKNPLSPYSWNCTIALKNIWKRLKGPFFYFYGLNAADVAGGEA